MSWLGNIAARLKAGNTVSKSGGVAKERLSIILAHQRGDELMQTIDLEKLQQEILQLMKVGDVCFILLSAVVTVALLTRGCLSGKNCLPEPEAGIIHA